MLTDEPYFQGRLEYLTQIRAAVDTPLLRKDFILDGYQLLEARVAGADAVLLIAECLDDRALGELHEQAVALGMTPLVEFYEPQNCPRVLAAGARLVGVNNRDLRTFETDLEHTLRMRAQIPADRLLVSESGIRGPGRRAAAGRGGRGRHAGRRAPDGSGRCRRRRRRLVEAALNHLLNTPCDYDASCRWQPAEVLR